MSLTPRVLPTVGILVPLLVFGLLPATASAGEWISDFEKAKTQASKEGKDLLIDFTGSDWCGWCIRLKQEVFTQETFEKEAPKKFVLVELDFPRAKQLPEATRKQNALLQEKFGVEGFPTIFLTDASGRAYARTGYQPGGAEKYLEHLEELAEGKKTRDKLFHRAKKAEGVGRAKLLDEGLDFLAKRGVLVGYDKEIDEIIELDADNEGGLKKKYEARRHLSKIESVLSNGKFDDAVNAADKFVEAASPEGEILQQALYLKALALFQKEDLKASIATLEEARKAAPESEMGMNIVRIVERLKASADQSEDTGDSDS